MEQLLLRMDEAAEALGVGRTKLYQLVRRGQLPVVRIDGVLRVPVEALRQHVTELADKSRVQADGK